MRGWISTAGSVVAVAVALPISAGAQASQRQLPAFTPSTNAVLANHDRPRFVTGGRPFYVTEVLLDTFFEQHGVYYNGRLVGLDDANCVGRPYDGFHRTTYGPTYWRFHCILTGLHEYSAEVSTTTGPRRGVPYVNVLKIHQDL